jgi:DNA helicase HerA-like ATPase
MTSNTNFIFGKNLINPNETVFWNPNREVNGHLMILGGSGAGKTTLLRPICTYLKRQNLILHILDTKGDVYVEDENLIEFTGRESKYGINPFEFDVDPKNGGPSIQAHEIINMFNRSFMKDMRSVQKGVLRRLILDTYLSKGFDDADPKTWTKGLDLSKRESKISWGKTLPSLNDMLTLLTDILEMVETGLDASFTKANKKISKTLIAWNAKLQKINSQIAELGDELANPQQHADEIKFNKKLVAAEQKKEDLIKQVAMYKQKLLSHYSNYIDYTYLDGERDLTAETQDVMQERGYEFIDLSYYSKKDVVSVLNTLSVHLANLTDTGVFSSNVPPVIAGANRYDISGLTADKQSFFVSVMVRKLFRAVRARGEYVKLPEHKKRGEKFDTVVVIDEAQLVMPRNQEANDPTETLNRVVAEARGYGMIIVVLSQSPKNFPIHYLTNIHKKIVLKTAHADFASAKSTLGLKEKDFKRINQIFGTALISQGDEFTPTVLPWVDKEALEKA